MQVIQLSDPHVDHRFPQKAAAFARAVAHVNTMPVLPDAVLITGDCVEHGRPDEYDLFGELLSALRVPAFIVPGNHDHRETLLQRYPPPTPNLPGFMQYAVEDFPLRLIGLDTHRPGQAGGALDRARLDWLEAQLREAPERPTLLFMHHPPLHTGLTVMDGMDLRGREALCDLLLEHPQVLRVVAGHLHMSVTAGFAHTTVMTCPGTDATLNPDLNQPAQLVVQRQPPTCLLHHWAPETGLNTFTQVIAPAPWHALFDGSAWHDFDRPNGAPGS
ncbi:metallophosphoesterase [Deinococcus radiotolerans]|uniref:3',5'-cyclic adenosine monophosphate phosphodiesterase CpdA n=1 Tax=Deinococcus radiotolerans TaxID=1309407 RepID=A0ABQ2FJA9_9DEIO|nr:metallophosphoesterase [Deinococcus radiotolerans]GGK94914.1 3',5'-cyclic adenosine monophosphate phosphodiesterase CpdA [Deinococcus radiotolerans]